MTLSTLLIMAVAAQESLPGSKLSLAQAKEEAHFIVVAEINETGLVAGSGPSACGSITRLKLSAMLKGETTEREINRYPLSVSALGPERLPKQGEEYILFLAELRGHLVVSKLMVKSEANVAAVRVAGPYVPARPRPGSPDGPGRSRPGRPMASPPAVVLPLRRIVKSALGPGRGAIDERRQE